MKRTKQILAGMLALLAGQCVVVAQGQVSMYDYNYFSVSYQSQFLGCSKPDPNSMAANGANWTIQLYGAVGADLLPSALSPLSGMTGTFTNNFCDGEWNSDAVYTFLSGSVATVQLYVWYNDGDTVTSYKAALAAGLPTGYSDLANVPLSGAASGPPATTGSLPTALGSFSVGSKPSGFMASPTNGAVPLTVQFSRSGFDGEGNAISNWNWAFGDGSFSTNESPLHVYLTSGTFSPTLIATNSGGGWEVDTGTVIQVSIPPNFPFTFITNSGAITITGYTGTDPSVTIPPTINGLPVGSINGSTEAFGVIGGRPGAFENSALANVVIPDSVTNIGNAAFANCTNLASITIPASVVNLVSARDIAQCLSVGPGLNFGCHYPGVFEGCSSLSNVTVVGGLDSIGTFAFANCTNLTDFAFDGTTNIGVGAFYDCASLINLTVPNTVTSIGDGAFANCLNLEGLSISNGVIDIGNYVFQDCITLTNVIIPDSVSSIGAGPFAYCSSLEGITVETNNVDFISPGGVLFNENQTELLQYPGGNTGNQYTLPNTVVSIGAASFAGCENLATVVLDNGITNIGALAFADCSSLTNITIPASVTTIGEEAFTGCAGLIRVNFFGNAPAAAVEPAVALFSGNTNLAVYYLPDTSGWSNTFAGVPALPWVPALQIGNVGSVSTNSAFTFDVSWAYGRTVVIEACTNLVNPDWHPLQTNSIRNGAVYFNDPNWTNYLGRFYRAVGQ